jgi:RNA polymerase sigma factor for flagellar operon FliA
MSPKTTTMASPASKAAPKRGSRSAVASAAPATPKPQRSGRAAPPADPRTALWRAYLRHPTPRQRNPLVETYQPLVREVVRKIAARLPRFIESCDLETAGSVGLMAAIEGFDPSRGVRFEKYCEMRIRGAVLDELRSQDWLPRPFRSRVERHKRVREELRATLDREPSDEEAARAMGLEAEEYALLRVLERSSGPPSQLGAAGQGDEEARPLETLASRSADAPEERLSREDLLQLVAQRLTDQEYRIAYLRYWEDLSMREIGDLERLSESRVCRIHAKLIDRLRDRFRAHVEV